MSLEIVSADGLPAVRIISPRRQRDARGFFSEVWREDQMTGSGIDLRFIQENHALSCAAGTVRGLHFQVGKSAQAKLIRCPRGSILDVAVDIRRGSPTYGRYATVVLSDENWKQCYVPAGFAHGYCTLQPNTEVIYKVNRYYSREHDLGLAWNDPRLGIAWPVSEDEAVLSDKDRRQPALADLLAHFRYA